MQKLMSDKGSQFRENVALRKRDEPTASAASAASVCSCSSLTLTWQPDV